MPTTLRHRHLVILPVFLLLMVASMIPAFFPGRSLTASVIDDGHVRDLGGGLQARVEDGGVLTSGIVPSLEQGRALFRTEGIAQVRLPVGSVLAMAGAFHIVIDGSNVTVSAITAPVYFSLLGHSVLIPAGMQYQVSGELPGAEASVRMWLAARRTTPLPTYFLHDQLQVLRGFSTVDWLPKYSSLPSERFAEPAVQLPAAQERERAAWRVRVVGALRAALDHDEEDVLSKILATRAFDPALADPQSLSAVIALAARPQTASSVRASLLMPVRTRHDLWLLAAVHPVLRGSAWTEGEAALTPEEEMILAFGLPATDRNQEGYSPVVLAWWAQNVLGQIAIREDPVEFVTILLEHHIPTLRQYVGFGYPERAQILASALESFAESVRAALPVSVLESLAQARRLVSASSSLLDTVAEEASSASSSSSLGSARDDTAVSSVSLEISPEERVGRVESALERAGALFGVQTKIEALPDGQSVHVSGILFASAAGDRTYAFDVDIAGNLVSSIVRDGRLMPYPMDLTAFLKWVRK